MKREELIAMGISEENADKIMADYGSSIQKANAKADVYKAKADKADELQSQLDEINSQNLSEVEKANKALETANNRIAELEKAQAISTQKSAVIEKFKVTAEQANQIVKDDGSLDMDVLGQIISDKETAAATAKEQEIAKKAGSPGGGSAGGKGGEEKSNAEKLATKLFSKQKDETDILSHYVGGN